MKPGGRADHPIELLSASIDRELKPAESAALETHLEACAECRGLLGDFRRLDEAIAAEPAPPVPAGLEERILAGLPSRQSPFPSRPFWRQAMPLAAAASLVMAVLLWVGRPDRLPPIADSSRAIATDAGAPVESPAARSDAPAASPESKSAAASNAMKKADREVAAPRKAPPAPGQVEPLVKAALPAAGKDQWKVESAPNATPGASGTRQEAAREAAPTPAGAAPAAAAPAPAADEIQVDGKQKEQLEEEDAGAMALDLLPLCEASAAPAPLRGTTGHAAAVAARPGSRPFALLVSPYAVRLEPDHRLRMERGDYTCTVTIDDMDGRTIAAALDESLRSSTASPVKALQAAAPCLVPATPAARQAVVRLIQERYRGVILENCGALPN
ncbi:MAG TPA: zf-HC2 domain-containing protein [Candidatus Polarisedimenticolia bacterium]|nr:zf-HC2 domain-containing protein [Candidatus Polarisedimenticolia bacterium]